MQIYADNAATTALSPKVLEAMTPYLTEVFGNPSSLYRIGAKAKDAVEDARKKIADLIGAKSEAEIYFTSGGSEADNWAIKGVCRILKEKGKNHIITTKFEHHAVLHVCGSGLDGDARRTRAGVAEVVGKRRAADVHRLRLGAKRQDDGTGAGARRHVPAGAVDIARKEAVRDRAAR